MTLQELLAQYDRRRGAAEKRLAEQEKALFLAHPALGALQERRQELILAQLLAVMKKPQEKQAALEDFAQRMQQLEAEKTEYICAHGIELPRLEVQCPICQDTGYIQQGNRKQFCPCLREQLYEKVLGGQSIAALEGSFAAFDEAVFPDTQPSGQASQRSRMLAIRSFAEGYCQAFPENQQRQLLFMGKPGLGKSYLLACICKQLYAQQRDICYLGSYALFELFHRDRLGESALLPPVYEAKVLVIDDLGSEPMTQNVTREYFFDLLCARARAGLHTFMATNYTPEQLRERYTERVSSRLLSRQQSMVIRFSGEDLRLL
ncbi:MAG: ATP-binding protein [Clostridiales bacterium]|nr:ATP-binding protein [Clostridiales bacterium]